RAHPSRAGRRPAERDRGADRGLRGEDDPTRHGPLRHDGHDVPPAGRRGGRRDDQRVVPLHGRGWAGMTVEGVRYDQVAWDDVTEGQALPAVRQQVTYRKVAMNPGATWDYFPGHHDPFYAQSQGQPTIYVNTLHVLGFVDRFVTDWAG